MEENSDLTSIKAQLEEIKKDIDKCINYVELYENTKKKEFISRAPLYLLDLPPKIKKLGSSFEHFLENI